MKIGVIGGTGNISATVVRRLLHAGHEVTCINRGLSGAVPDGARLLTGDRGNVDWFIPEMRAQRFDAAMDFYCFRPEQAAATRDAFAEVGHLVHVSTVTTYGAQFDWLPVTEDHPDRPNMLYGAQKSQADQILLSAHLQSGLPVTVVKPSTTYGPRRVLRQIGIDSSWISRIRQGRPILEIGDGRAIHHLLHVEDAAVAFAALLGRDRCIGQTYNLVNPESTTWHAWHLAAMAALDREVELVGVPMSTLLQVDAERFAMARDIFSHNLLFSSAKLLRDVPEFRPRISAKQGLSEAIEYLDRNSLVEDPPIGGWEDRVIGAQQRVAQEAEQR